MAESKKEKKEKVAETKESQEETNQEISESIEKQQVENVLVEIERLKAENEKYFDHLQRTAAEFDNYKKRVSKEKEKIYALAIGDAVSKYIPVLDNIEKALMVETTDTKMKEGLELIRKQILTIMSEFRVEEIPTVNEKFDPEVHDAVMHVESGEFGEKIVIEELRKGYKLGDRVIRHAMVKVAN